MLVPYESGGFGDHAGKFVAYVLTPGELDKVGFPVSIEGVWVDLSFCDMGDDKPDV